jgi:hypothetical protein
MQRHAGPRRGARAAGMTSPVGPKRARASRASHAPRMGPHGPSSADFDKRMHVLPMQRHAGPPARRPGGWAAPFRWPGDGPSSAARRMGRAWARTWAEQRLPSCVSRQDACAPHAAACGPMRGVWVAGPRPSVGRLRACASADAAWAAHGPAHGPSSADFDKRMHVLPMRRHAGPCAASGWPGRALPLAGSGLASAARRMGRAWARMGHRTSSGIALIALIASQRAFTVELTEQIRQEKDSS